MLVSTIRIHDPYLRLASAFGSVRDMRAVGRPARILVTSFIGCKLSGLLRPSAGSAVVAGFSVQDEPHEVRARIGILTEVPGLYLRLTPAEYLDFFVQPHPYKEPLRFKESLHVDTQAARTKVGN